MPNTEREGVGPQLRESNIQLQERDTRIQVLELKSNIEAGAQKDIPADRNGARRRRKREIRKEGRVEQRT